MVTEWNADQFGAHGGIEYTEHSASTKAKKTVEVFPCPEVNAAGDRWKPAIQASTTETFRIERNKAYRVVSNVDIYLLAVRDNLAHSTATNQDFTYTSVGTGLDSQFLEVEFTDTATAGSEVAIVSGGYIEVQIESGVSTATQILAALNASADVLALLIPVISGVGSNAQVAADTHLVNPSPAYPSPASDGGMYLPANHPVVIQSKEMDLILTNVVTTAGFVQALEVR